MNPTTASGFWQTLLISAAAVIVLLEILRGWRLGPLRQATRLVAILTAYTVAIVGGRAAVPLVRPLLRMPDIVIQTVAGSVLALLAYAIITSVGTYLFRRTDQQENRGLRLVYGISGAVLGIGFGLFVVWLLFTGVRVVGAMADAALHAQPETVAGSEPAESHHAVRSTGPHLVGGAPDASSLVATLASMRGSLDNGVLASAVRKTDPLPQQTFGTLTKLTRVLSQPRAAERFVQFPGAREIAEHPKIVALRDDPALSRSLADGHLFDVLQNQRLIDAMNDPTLTERIRKFDLDRALDYALQAQR